MGYFDNVEETKIEKSKGGVKEKYPFSKLEIGESFSYPKEVSVFTMRCSAYQRGDKLGRKFKVHRNTNTVERIA